LQNLTYDISTAFYFVVFNWLETSEIEKMAIYGQVLVKCIHFFHSRTRGNLPKGRVIMKKVLVFSSLMLLLLVGSGCSSKAGSAGLGAVGGAVVGAGGYEYHLNNQKKQVEDDLKSGKIDQKEHDIRIDQIKKDSLLQ
jgi:hypothetical protein